MTTISINTSTNTGSVETTETETETRKQAGKEVGKWSGRWASAGWIRASLAVWLASGAYYSSSQGQQQPGKQQNFPRLSSIATLVHCCIILHCTFIFSVLFWLYYCYPHLFISFFALRILSLYIFIINSYNYHVDDCCCS